MACVCVVSEYVVVWRVCVCVCVCEVQVGWSETPFTPPLSQRVVSIFGSARAKVGPYKDGALKFGSSLFTSHFA